VRSRLVVVGDVLAQYPPQMPLVEHDHVVQAPDSDWLALAPAQACPR
jgi:hypothetical protein